MSCKYADEMFTKGALEEALFEVCWTVVKEWQLVPKRLLAPSFDTMNNHIG